jgi:predicted nucleic acid-binding protein
MKVAINASPLIFLGKLDRLDCLTLFNKVYTTNTVLSEINKGIGKGYNDALLINKAVEDGLISIETIRTRKTIPGLHPGELSVIELAKKKKLDAVIIDDRAAIKAAKYFGLNVMSTPYLFLLNVKEGKMDKKEFKETMARLIGLGYFISPDLYVRILDVCDKL